MLINKERPCCFCFRTPITACWVFFYWSAQNPYKCDPPLNDLSLRLRVFTSESCACCVGFCPADRNPNNWCRSPENRRKHVNERTEDPGPVSKHLTERSWKKHASGSLHIVPCKNVISFMVRKLDGWTWMSRSMGRLMLGWKNKQTLWIDQME